jgi:dienelactone hydrolase
MGAFAAVVLATAALPLAVGAPGAGAQTDDSYAVGVVHRTFVDRSRETAANGDAPASPQRSLDTTIYYPAAGTPAADPAIAPATEDAPPADGPFPLLVFAHGFGATPAVYEGILKSWAAAGYVAAAPAFPLSNTGAPGGPNPGDFVHQPGDMSFVVTSLTDRSDDDDVLDGLVDATRVGVAGHSLGGITTLGIAAHSCCQDERVKAAIVLAGDPLSYPKGRFDYAQAPPLLLVHGTEDSAVDYRAGIDVFNAARGPKGLVTIEGGDHGSPISVTGPAFPSVLRSTTAFFDTYVKGDRAARRDIGAAAEPGVTEIRFVAKRGARTTITTTPQQTRDLQATVTPRRNLRDGQEVTVEWSGYTPGKSINIVQCSSHVNGDAASCDLQTGYILQPNPTGEGSIRLPIVVGPVGTGVCDAEHECDVVVNDGGSLDPAASVRVTIRFAK